MSSRPFTFARHFGPPALLAGAVLAAVCSAAPATPPKSAGRPGAVAPQIGFAAFQLIAQRNIFDPNRTGPASQTAADAPQGDTIALVGTMNYAKGLFAFFTGSSASFQQTLRVGEKIERFTVVHIRPDGVDLTRDGHPLALAIGQQLQRPVGGDWQLAAADPSRLEAASSGAGTASAPAIPADASDTLKRLMEKRQKELQP